MGHNGHKSLLGTMCLGGKGQEGLEDPAFQERLHPASLWSMGLLGG